MELQTILRMIADVSVSIVLLYLIFSVAALYDKIEKLEAKGKDLNDVMIKMWELSKTEKSRQFVSDMLINYNRMRDEEFSDAVSTAQAQQRGRQKILQTGEKEQE